MQNVITFRIWSQEWMEMSKEDQEGIKRMKSVKDLELIKYQSSFAFTFAFDVLEHKVNRNEKFEFPGGILDDLTKVEFQGEETSSYVLISNSLLTSEFSAKKSGAKEYCYFYIRHDAEYFRITDTVWLNKASFEKLEKAALGND